MSTISVIVLMILFCIIQSIVFLISDELKALDAERIKMLFEEMNATVRNIEK